MKKTLWTLFALIVFFIFSILTLKIGTGPINASDVPSEISEILSPDKLEQAIIFSDFRNGWYFFSTVFDLLLLAGILWLGFSGKMKSLAEKLTEKLHSAKSPSTIGCVIGILVATMITFFAATDKHLIEAGNLFMILIWGIIGYFAGRSRGFAVKVFYLLVFGIITGLVDFPLSYYRMYIVEHHFGLSNETFGAWFADEVKSMYLGGLFFVLITPLAYWAINKRKRDWWLWISVAAVPIMIIILVIVPVFVQPMFNKFEPLKDEALAQRILTMAEGAGIQGGRVYQVDMSSQTEKVNAYVTGLFGSKRIVLWDTTIKKFTPDEIAFVMAHEMGHYVLNHIWIGIALFSVILLFLLFIIYKTIGALITRFGDRFGFHAIDDIASLPLLMLMLSLMMFIIDPVTNGYSRYIEHQADKFGLNITRDGATAAKAFAKLANENLSNPQPSAFMEFWLWDHPTLKDRIDFCKAYVPLNQ